jgi:predicted transcriptional regulator
MMCPRRGGPDILIRRRGRFGYLPIRRSGIRGNSESGEILTGCMSNDLLTAVPLFMQREKNVETTPIPGSLAMPQSDEFLLSLVARIVSAYMEHNAIRAQLLPGLIRDVYSALAGIGGEAEGTRAVTVKRKGPAGQTVFEDHLVCLECGLHMKMLKRHLQTVHHMTPVQYRATWGLAGDYPMVASQYAALRSSLAKESGLGKRSTPRGR